MKNLSSLSKINLLNIIIIAAIVVNSIVSTIEYGIHYGTLSLSILSIFLILLANHYIRKMKSYIEEMVHIFDEAQKGNFEIRKTNITETELLGKLGWSINNFLDQLEVFMREVNTSIDYAAQNKYFRRIDTNGLNSGFEKTSQKINAAIDAMEAEYLVQVEKNFASELGKTGKPLPISFQAIQKTTCRRRRKAQRDCKKGAKNC